MDAETAIEIAKSAYANTLEFIAADGDIRQDSELFYGAPADYPRGYWIVSLVQGDRVGSTLTIVVRKCDGEVVWIGHQGE